MDQDESVVETIDPTTAAEQYVNSQLERYHLNPGIDFWEGWNEFVPTSPARMAWYAIFEARRACYMQEKGFRAAVGGFSTGVPEYADMEIFTWALEGAYRCGGIFTLHEYASPDFQCGTSVNRAGVIPGAPVIEDKLVGPLAFRYRFWYEGLLKPRGLGALPLVISELGISGILPSAACQDPGGSAWKNYSDFWVHNGYGPTGPEAYVNILAWYDQQMRQDRYVLGATVFTAGPAGGWSEYDLHDMLLPLARYAVKQEAP
jgi:hypothetical protein